MAKVRDYMSSPIFQVEANTSIQEVCKLMVERGIGSVLVTEQGQPKGIFTDRDAVKAFAMGLSPTDEVRLASTMGNLETVHMDDDVFKAMEIMSKKKIRHLPVRDDQGNIVGMLSILDASRAVSELSK